MRSVAAFLDEVLKGVSQIMLQENRLTGVLFLLGLFIGSWECGAAAFLASAVGTLSARAFRFDRALIQSGFYGFSAALVGVVLVFLFEGGWQLWLLVLFGAFLATLLQHLFYRFRIPAFTFPFILVAWLFVFLLNHFADFPPSPLASASPIPTAADALWVTTKSFGQVIFQGGLLSGILFFIGVLLNRPAAAFYGILAAVLGSLLSYWNKQPIEDIHLGLYGFNAVLTAIVFAGWRWQDALWVLMGVLLTVAINNVLVMTSALAVVGGVFTFPFVAGTWLTLLLRRLLR